jgi:hypothetical protein
MDGLFIGNIKNSWINKITFCLETSGGQNSTVYINVVRFFNISVNYTSVAD